MDSLVDSPYHAAIAFKQRSYQSIVAGGISRAVKLNRQQRKALVKRHNFLHSLPPDVRQYHTENPEAKGSPRSYYIRFTDLTNPQDHPESVALNSQVISFGSFGQHTGINLNGHHIEPKDVHYAPATRTYTFKTVVHHHHRGCIHVTGVISFLAEQPTGTINIGERSFNITLNDRATWFDVDLSTDAKSYYSSGKGGLVFDKADFDKATWKDGKFIFGWDNINNGDPVQPEVIQENYFIDASTSPQVEFDLKLAQYGSDYTCTFDTEKAGLMTTKVTEQVPAAPSTRSNSDVKSVFPTLWCIQFSPFGDSFYGAYQVGNNGPVYSVQGNLRLLDTASIVSILSKPTGNLPAVDIVSFLHDPVQLNGHSAEQADTRAEHQKTNASFKMEPAPALKVTELLGMDVMVPDDKDPSGFRDSVATLAMQDYHDLIIYFMDDDLRNSFVQATKPILPPYLLAIANDSPANSDFYKSLQVPFISTMLAHQPDPSDAAKQLNYLRADMKMKTVPSTNPIYKSHSAKLYRYHFLQKFPTMQTFLNDQKKDHNQDVDKFIETMKSKLSTKAEVTKATNPDYDKDLKVALTDIDNLGKWAKSAGLYWALQMLYWLQNSSLPNWYAQYSTGTNRSAMVMNMKKLNGIFGILEDNRKNPAKDGKNFMQSFNEDMRLFQMTSIIPLLIDVNGVSSELDTITKECLEEFITHYSNSPDKAMLEQVQLAQQLVNDANLRLKFFLPWAAAQRLASTTRTWNNMASIYQKIVTDAKWFQNLQNGSQLLSLASTAACAGFIIMGFLPMMRDKMSPGQKVAWGISMAGLLAGLLSRVIAGTIRFLYFYNDISGFGNSLKVLFGFENVIDNIENSAFRIENGFLRFMARTSKQTLELGQMDALLIKAGEQGEFSIVERAIGRNMGEVLGTVLGLIMSIVTIVLVSIDIAKESDLLLKLMDIMMLCSAVIQLVAIVAGVVVGLLVGVQVTGALAVGLAAITACAAWGGPLAIVFCIIGIIIFLVWLSRQDTRSPVEKFLDDRADPAGLKMAGPEQAPEYFQLIPAQKGSPSLVGLALKGPVGGMSQWAYFASIPDSAQRYLQLDVEKKGLNPTETLNYSQDMVWSMSVDQDGNCLLYTINYAPDPKTPTIKKGTIWYIATDDTDTDLEIRELPNNEPERTTVLPHFQWTVSVDAPSVTDDKQVQSAHVTITRGKRSLGQLYDVKGEIVDPQVKLLNLEEKPPGGKTYANLYLMSMQPVRPGELSYMKNPWTITDQSTDELNYPRFAPSDASSAGLEWSISPALPEGKFKLITSGDSEGTIEQVAGVTAPIQAATQYTISCQLPGKSDSVQKTTITLEVVDHNKIDETQ